MRVCSVAPSCLTLCDPMDYSQPGSSVHGIFQARILAAAAKSPQSCPTLCDPIDSSPPGSSVPGILQARTLEWVSISSSRGSSRPRDRTRVCSPASQVDSFPLSHWESLAMNYYTAGKRGKGTHCWPGSCVCLLRRPHRHTADWAA